MDIAIVSFIVLGAIAIAVISYIVWRRTSWYDVQILRAELEWQKLARREQERKYDELYDSFLRVNQYNTELTKEVQKYKNTFGECADEVYAMFLAWYSRKELCKLYPSVAYSTLCNWIRRKKKEAESSVNPTTAKSKKLF